MLKLFGLAFLQGFVLGLIAITLRVYGKFL